MTVGWMGCVRVGMVVGVVFGAGMALQAQPPTGRPPRIPPPPATPIELHTPIPLWLNGAPGSEGKTGPETSTATMDGEDEHRVATINNPSLTPFLVRGAKTPTAAVIIAPGGGHQFLSIEMEGYDVARYLSGHGVTAFVLKYRLSRQPGSTYTMDNEVADAQRAIRQVRAHAAEWNVDPERIGMMGFSAGGELTMRTLEALPAVAAPGVGDEIDRQSGKLAFVALMYPGSVSPEMVTKVSSDMPPAFMLCGADDSPAISQRLPELFVAWRKAGVSAELHEYASVGHGFGLRFNQHGAVADWPLVFVEWMDTKGLLRK